MALFCNCCLKGATAISSPASPLIILSSKNFARIWHMNGLESFCKQGTSVLYDSYLKLNCFSCQISLYVSSNLSHGLLVSMVLPVTIPLCTLFAIILSFNFKYAVLLHYILRFLLGQNYLRLEYEFLYLVSWWPLYYPLINVFNLTVSSIAIDSEGCQWNEGDFS